MAKLIRQTPRIAAYWTGYQRITDYQPFDPSHPIPEYVKNIDVIPLAFCLVRNNTIQYTCGPGETSLAMGTDRNGWTQEQIKQWVQETKSLYPDTHFTLSIGGAEFNDWGSVTSPGDFAVNVMNRLVEDWMGEIHGRQTLLVSGIDVDYEGGGLPGNISYEDIVKALNNVLSSYGGMEEFYLSMPYYSGSPWTPSTANLQDVITYATTMGYGFDLYDYDALVDAGYRATKGFSWASNGLEKTASFVSEKNLTCAMYWDLGMLSNQDKIPPMDYIDMFNDRLPR